MLAAVITACKPTEKNYQAAYDAAGGRKAESNIAMGGEIMESLDGPHIEIVDNDTILVGAGTVKAVGENVRESPDKIGIAVASYKMLTNASSHAADLVKAYPDAFVAFDGTERYYVVIGRVPNVKNAPEIIKEFKSRFPEYSYIGLPGAPVTVLIY